MAEAPGARPAVGWRGGGAGGGRARPRQRFPAAAVFVVRGVEGPELGSRREFQVGISPRLLGEEGGCVDQTKRNVGGSPRDSLEVPGLSGIKRGMAFRP